VWGAGWNSHGWNSRGNKGAVGRIEHNSRWDNPSDFGSVWYQGWYVLLSKVVSPPDILVCLANYCFSGHSWVCRQVLTQSRSVGFYYPHRFSVRVVRVRYTRLDLGHWLVWTLCLSPVLFQRVPSCNLARPHKRVRGMHDRQSIYCGRVHMSPMYFLHHCLPLLFCVLRPPHII
jgi:hypothetical protein